MIIKKIIFGTAIALFLLISVQVMKTIHGLPAAIEIETQKVKGPPSAPNFIVVFSDFQCGYCYSIRPSLDAILKAFPNDIKLVYKHFLLDRHKISPLMAEASECAADQGKFWEMHDKLYDNGLGIDSTQENQRMDLLEKYSKEINLNVEQFKQCLASGRKKEIINKNHQEGENYRISGTPTILFNGKKILKIPLDNPEPTIQLIRSMINKNEK